MFMCLMACFSSFQSLSHVRLFATSWTAAHQACLSITNSWSLPKLISIELMMPSNHLILCCPLPLLPLILTSIRVFSDESALCIRLPKYWNFSFSISPSNEYSGLITVESESRSVMSDSLCPHGLHSPWNSPGQNTGVGSFSLLEGIVPTQGSNPGLLHYRWILYQLSHKRSPRSEICHC